MAEVYPRAGASDHRGADVRNRPSVRGLPLTATIALGAAVAPPDPVAATAVTHKLRLPRRLRTILEGEGLSNDATSLVLYEVGDRVLRRLDARDTTDG